MPRDRRRAARARRRLGARRSPGLVRDNSNGFPALVRATLTSSVGGHGPETKEARLAEAWRRATTEPRGLDAVVRIPGLGHNLYAFTELPSFSPGYSWEVRRLQGEWAVFRSEVVQGAGAPQLLGYQRLKLRPRALDAKISAFAALSLDPPSALDLRRASRHVGASSVG